MSRFFNTPGSRAAAGLAVLVLVSTFAFAFTRTSTGAAAATSQPPIRIVRFTLDHPTGLKLSYQVAYDACLAQKGMPPAPAPMPADRVLAAFRGTETEELFDGALRATFHVRRRIDADPANGCKPVVVSARRADVVHACKWAIKGNASALEDMATPPAVTEEDWSDGCEGLPTPQAQAVPDQVPQDNASGVPCVWTSALLTAALGMTPPAPGPDANAVDFCLYAKRPDYVARDMAHPLMLKSHVARYTGHFERGDSMLGPETLESFSEGTAIPAARFTRAAVEDFIRKPLKEPLGVTQ